jgi:hypothetical protein
VELIGKLYAIERELPALLPPADDVRAQEQRRQREEQRRQIRQQQAKPILEELKGWLDAEKPKALPKSLLGDSTNAWRWRSGVLSLLGTISTLEPIESGSAPT